MFERQHNTNPRETPSSPDTRREIHKDDLAVKEAEAEVSAAVDALADFREQSKTYRFTHLGEYRRLKQRYDEAILDAKRARAYKAMRKNSSTLG